MFEPLLERYVGLPITEQNLHALKFAVARVIADLAAQGLIPPEYASISPGKLFRLEVSPPDVIVVFCDERLRELLAQLGLGEGP